MRPRKPLRSLSGFLLISTFLGGVPCCVPAWAGPTLRAGLLGCLLREIDISVPEPGLDSAVELETEMSPELMAILTTTDGTLRPVLGDLPAPQWLAPLVRQRKVQAAFELPWDAMSYSEKLQLLQYAARKRGDDFKISRAIPGIRVRPRIEMMFNEPNTRFLGRTYEEPGVYTVDVSRVLRGKVEYMDPRAVEAVSGVELHFRGDRPSGDLSADARVFQLATGMRVTHQHVHQVGPLPLAALRANPREESALLGDFVRRVNLYAEILTLLKNGTIDRKEFVQDGYTIEYAGNFTAENYGEITHWFFRGGLKGSLSAIGNRFKVAWIGIRGPEKYDRPGLWGIENRWITARMDTEVARKVLNLLQARMLREEFIAPEQAPRFERWLRDQLPGLLGRWVRRNWRDPSSAISGASYNQPASEVIADSPRELREAMGPRARALVESSDSSHAEIKMLLFDWSRDPLFYGDEGALNRIRASQLDALQGLRRGLDLSRVMRKFVTESGIARAVEASLAF